MDIIKNISIIFISIFFESLPFLLLGAFISAIIETKELNNDLEEQYVYPCYSYGDGISFRLLI